MPKQERNYCIFLNSAKYKRNIGCKKHDNAYGINGGGNEEDRKKADLMLFTHMRKNKDYLAFPVCVGVRLFGWLFFNYHEYPWRGQLIYKIFRKK